MVYYLEYTDRKSIYIYGLYLFEEQVEKVYKGTGYGKTLLIQYSIFVVCKLQQGNSFWFKIYDNILFVCNCLYFYSFHQEKFKQIKFAQSNWIISDVLINGISLQAGF